MIKSAFGVFVFLMTTAGLVAAPHADAAPCLVVTLTGTGTPYAFRDLAGAGTLVRYGDDANSCSAVSLQFDAGRGTLMRLSQVGVQPWQLNAILFTHIHSDHVEGFAEIAQMRWLFGPASGPKLDVICSRDAKSPAGFVMSCNKFVASLDDAYRQSGEIAQRATERRDLDAAGPIALMNVITFESKDAAQVVWQSGDVKVSAIRSTHIPGHASYRVDTPVGSVVIGGDAANDVPQPPRKSSTSEQVEQLAAGADIIVHSAVHPVLAPEKGSGAPPPIYYRQSNVTDLGAMAQRAGAKYLMLTHLAPSLGAQQQGPWKVPGGPLTEADFRKAAQAGGFTGNIIVGTDLASVRLPAK
jgi:ribonuclease Z